MFLVFVCVARALARRFEADLRVVSPAVCPAPVVERAGRFFAVRRTLLRVLFDAVVVRLAAERVPDGLRLLVMSSDPCMHRAKLSIDISCR